VILISFIQMKRLTESSKSQLAGPVKVILSLHNSNLVRIRFRYNHTAYCGKGVMKSYGMLLNLLGKGMKCLGVVFRIN